MTSNTPLPGTILSAALAAIDEDAWSRSSNEALTRLSRLAARLLSTPAASVTLVGAERQVFVGSVGNCEPFTSLGESPLSHSLCTYVVQFDQPLVIRDARVDPLVCDSAAATALNVTSYLGVPLRDRTGKTIGSFCVMDTVPRNWSDADVALVNDLADGVMAELDNRGLCRVLLNTANAYRDLLDITMEMVCAADGNGVITYVNRAWTRAFGYAPSEVIGTRAIDLLAPEHRARYVNVARQLQKGEAVEDFEVVLIGEGGRRVVCRGNATASHARDGDGTLRCVGTRAVYQDVTAERMAETARARLVATLEATSDLVTVADVGGNLEFINTAGRRLLGLGENVDAGSLWVKQFHPPATLELLEKSAIPSALRDGVWRGDGELISLDGDLIPVSIAIVAHPSLVAGEAAHVSSIMRDMREKVAAEAALRQSEATFRAMLQTLRNVAVTLDANGCVTFANEALLSLTGWKWEHVEGQDWFQRFVPEPADIRAVFDRMMQGEDFYPHFDKEIITCSGRIRLIEWDVTVLRDASGAIVGTASIGHDVTDQRDLEDRLAELSESDDLTGLYNRRGFVERVERELNIARDKARCDAMLYIDLDHFKQINDTFGHAAGDEALRSVGDLLTATLRDRDIISRLGGDEFAVLAVDVPGADGAQSVAGRLLAALEQHNAEETLRGRPYRIEFSIGAIAVTRAHTCDTLFAAADSALYDVKHRRVAVHAK